MRDTCYLVLSARGVTRMTKRAPDLLAGEVAFKVAVTVDNKHFRMPYAEATLTLDESHLIVPTVDVEVVDP